MVFLTIVTFLFSFPFFLLFPYNHIIILPLLLSLSYQFLFLISFNNEHANNIIIRKLDTNINEKNGEHTNYEMKNELTYKFISFSFCSLSIVLASDKYNVVVSSYYICFTDYPFAQLVAVRRHLRRKLKANSL